MADSAKLTQLENEVPGRAAACVQLAFQRSLEAGQTVLIAEEGKLFRIDPDKTRVEVKVLPARIKVTKGLKIQL